MKIFIAAAALMAAPALAQDEQPAPSDSESADSVLNGPDDIDVSSGWWECRRLVGLTGGIFETPRSWAFSGQGPVRPAGSPVFAMTCDRRNNTHAVTFGSETAPFYVHPIAGSADTARQWLSVSVGYTRYRSKELAYGPLVTVDWGRVLVGARVLHLPWGSKERPLGIEYRLQGTYDGGYGVQASVLATLSTTGAKR